MASTSPDLGLIAGRSKRSTAGNRMRALLDQQHSLTTNDEDDIFKEEENDNEFDAPEQAGQEEDVFDSDFADSEDEQEQDEDGQPKQKPADDEEAGERELQAEEDRRRKSARKAASRMAPSIVRRPKHKPLPAASVAGPASLVDSNAAGPSTSRSARRIAFAPDTRPDSQDPSSSSRRVSSRKATVQAGLDTIVRMEEAEARRLQHPAVRNPPSQVKKPSLNQAELIELALEREEENRLSLKAWMEGEEERKRNELVREKRNQPTSWLRWRSVRSSALPLAPPMIVGIQDDDNKDTEPAETAVKEATTSAQSAELPAQQEGLFSAEVPASLPQPIPPASEADDATAAPALQVQETSKVDFTLDPVLQARKEAAALAEAQALAAEKARLDPHSQASLNALRPSDLQSRTYLSLHYAEGTPIPPWPEQWSSMLGDHTDWSAPYFVMARNRPNKPRASLCPITGKMARYKDRKTGVAFADVTAARVLKLFVDEQQLEHQEEEEKRAGRSMARTPASSTSQGLLGDAARDFDWVEVDIDPTATDDTNDSPAPVDGQEDPKQAQSSSKKVPKKRQQSSGMLAAGGDGQGKTGFWMVAPDRSLAAATGSGLQASTSAGKRKAGPQGFNAGSGSIAAPLLPKRKKGRPSSSNVASPAEQPGQGILTAASAVTGPSAPMAPPLYTRPAIAPGDEKALMAEALAIPEGTTRSGRARASMGSSKK